MQQSGAILDNAQLKLSTGLQNPNPETAPSASTISKRMSFDIQDTKRISANATLAQNTAEIAWGNLLSIEKLYQEMRTLATQAANGIFNDQNRTMMNDQLQGYIAIADKNASAQWLGQTLSNGSFFLNCQVSSNPTSINSVIGSTIISPVALASGDLIINGIDIGAVTSGSTTAIASAINTVAGETGGVTASVSTHAIGSTFTQPYAGLIGNINITYQGTTKAVSVGPFFGTETVDQAVNMAVSAINTAFKNTSVSASNVNNALQIETSDGNTLGISYFNIYAENVAGPLANTYYSNITLSDYGSISISGNNPSSAGFTAQVIEPLAKRI